MNNDITENFILLTDAYKLCHWKQYPANTTKVYSYLESRGGQFDYTVFFGLQYFLKQYLMGVVVEQWMIEQADEECKDMFGADYFNRAGWQRIVNAHDGKLPIRIKAVKEGTIVNTKNVLMTIENTDPELPWLTNFLETLLLEVWYPITVATLSNNIQRLIGTYAEMCGCQVTPFHLNDFGFRGVSSPESAGIGGMAHLLNFAGTDTLRGIRFAKMYYDAPKNVGASVFATEHSTTTIYGRENEIQAYARFIDECPEGILSVVSDSYNIYDAIEMFGTTLKDKILERGKNTGFAKFVVRPDSGNPVTMSVEVIQLLDKYFGSTVNEKGFKTLNPKVGVIYGDGINTNSIGEILKAVLDAGYTTDCIVFGMGGALLQQVNRDTQKFAFKCCYAEFVDGFSRDVYKDPVTDKGKISKKGQLKLVNGNTVRLEEPGTDELVTVFENGELLVDLKFADIRLF